MFKYKVEQVWASKGQGTLSRITELGSEQCFSFVPGYTAQEEAEDAMQRTQESSINRAQAHELAINRTAQKASAINRSKRGYPH